ncbi:HNH endonuclease [Cellulomonas sp. 179-A 9B4 NHS]|uniref:HNH endonuclease n=1 Tax=Cellulomonas sp. 179-A 9B4 NHS TaxID=3142379 RepID=UPI0039A12017
MTVSAWSCYTRVSESLLDHSYGDVLGHRYEYDSNVINHRGIAVGDVIVLRDRQLVLGYGVVESVDSRPHVKLMRRCPSCRQADFATRKRALPRHRCNDCGHEFDEPLVVPLDVTAYAASYEASWIDFPSPVPVRVLDDVYAGKDRQNAIRRLDPDRAMSMLRAYSGIEGALQLQLVQHAPPLDGGHVEAVVRRRVNQGRFRERMLERFDGTCAVTGRQPEAVLDAAHLYSYAERPEHQDDGGLLLRADVHRLFDRLLLTIDPVHWRAEVAPVLRERHEHLDALHGGPLHLPRRVRPAIGLVADHRRAARDRWRDLART